MPCDRCRSIPRRRGQMHAETAPFVFLEAAQIEPVTQTESRKSGGSSTVRFARGKRRDGGAKLGRRIAPANYLLINA
jgi:hypothetical protein